MPTITYSHFSTLVIIEAGNGFQPEAMPLRWSIWDDALTHATFARLYQADWPLSDASLSAGGANKVSRISNTHFRQLIAQA